MTNRQALLSFYIKDGIEKFTNFAQSSLNKKKYKKNGIPEDNFELQPSIYNFIMIKPLQPTFEYLNREIINNLEGKGRSLLFDNEENVCIKDIHSFQLLYGKYLTAPKHTQLEQNSRPLNKVLSIKLGQQIFSKELQNSQFQLNLKIIEQTINGIKQRSQDTRSQFQNEIQMQLLLHRSQSENYNYYCDFRRQIQKEYESQYLLRCKQFLLNQQSQQISDKIISSTICRWFYSLLQSINMKDVLLTSRLIVEWEDSLIQKEKQQILAQQINGKLLFSIQNSINRCLETIKHIDYGKQYHLRQKKYGTNILQKQPLKNQKTHKISSFKSTNLMPFERQSSQDKRIDPHSKDQSYSQLAIRINNLRKNTPAQNSKRCHRFQYKKPSPLRQESMSQFQFIKNSKKTPTNRVVINNFHNQIKRSLAKFQVKFPLKIECYQMYSLNDSFLCYPAEEINVKELPLKFMKDRNKFGQNRVKIEYPVRHQANIAEIVCKSMQILNCLGGEVYCQQEENYKSTNTIDSSQILAISRLLERPVKQIVKYYREYNGGCSTKK